MKREHIEQIKEIISRLEGVAQGLTTFHSRLAWYIDQQAVKIRRIIEEYEDPFRIKPRIRKGALEDLDSEVPPLQEIQAEMSKKRTKGVVQDRKILESIKKKRKKHNPWI